MLTRSILSGFLLVTAMGCPTATDELAEITSVFYERDETRSRLLLQGTGFGLNRIEYDVSGSEGLAAQSSNYTIRLVDAQDQEIIAKAPQSISPTQMAIIVEPALDLDPGVYTVSLVFDPNDTIQDTAELTVQDPVIPPEIPFVDGFRFRRRLSVIHGQSAPAPAGTTFRLTGLDHAALVAAGKSASDGSDIAFFRGPTQLEHQWEDDTQKNTDSASFIVKLDVEIAIASEPDPPVLLYYGNAALEGNDTATDAVYIFAERYAGTATTGSTAGDWVFTCDNRDPDPALAASRSACITLVPAGRDYLTTLGTPTLPLESSPLAGVRYEVSSHLAGRMTGAGDLLFISYVDGETPDAAVTHVRDDAGHVFSQESLAPTDTVSFVPAGTKSGVTRQGFRLPVADQDFRLIRFQFIPVQGNPSLQFNFFSRNDEVPDLEPLVRLDDLTVRQMLTPPTNAQGEPLAAEGFTVNLFPEEARDE